MIKVVNNSTNLIPFEQVAVGDVFVKDGVAYIKTHTIFHKMDLVAYLEYNALDSICELGYDGYNAVDLEMGLFAIFEDRSLVTPVKKATLTLDY